MKKLFFVAIFFYLWILQVCNAQESTMHVVPYREKTMPFYLNCGNDVMINIDNYPFLDKMRFEVKGAEVIQGKSVNIFTVVPNQAKVTILAYEDDKLISQSTHPVRLLPKPDIELFIGGSFPYNSQRKYQLADLKQEINIKAIPEYEIAQAIPRDCKYSVVQFKALLKRKEEVLNELVVDNETLDLESFLEKAQSGDTLSFEVKSLKRTNYKGITEDVKFGNIIFNVPIH